jgi:hypothetical protein
MGHEYGMGYGMVGGMIGIVSWLVGMAIFGVPVAMVLRKAGYSPWWVIIAFVPPVNIVMLWVFALSRWPIEGQMRSGA